MENPLENENKGNNSQQSPSCKSHTIKNHKNEEFFLKNHSYVKSALKNFDAATQNIAINLLTYGIRIYKNYKKIFYHFCTFFISERNIRFLRWVSPKNKSKENQIDLLKVKLIHDNKYFDFHTWRNKDVFLFIVYADTKGKKRKLSLKFTCLKEKELFWQGLLHFIDEASALSDKKNNIALWASSHFSLSENNDKEMNFNELFNFLKKRELLISKSELGDVLQKININIEGKIVFNRNLIRVLFKSLATYDEIFEIFSNYCQEWFEEDDKEIEMYMTFQEFKTFFLEEQKQSIEDAELKKFKEIYRENNEETNSNIITLHEAKKILFSLNNQIFDINKMEYYQNTNHPLTDYYIKSSHNTYLQSNQLIGFSSVEAYIHALSEGYRCIELDCWDGDKGEPVIYHGYTFTSKIYVSNVLQAIVDHGFIKNKFPIILSIENHLKKEQQERLAELFVKICGEHLFVLPSNYEDFEYFPSLHYLKEKIIVKTKIPLLYDSAKLQNSSGMSESYNLVSQDIKNIKLEINIELNENIYESNDKLSICENAKKNGIIGGKAPNIFIVRSVYSINKKFHQQKTKKEMRKNLFKDIRPSLYKIADSEILYNNQENFMKENCSNSSKDESFYQSNNDNYICESSNLNIVSNPIFKINSEKVLSSPLKLKLSDEQASSTKISTNLIERHFSSVPRRSSEQAIPMSFDSNAKKQRIIIVSSFKKINEKFSKCVTLYSIKLDFNSIEKRPIFTITSFNEKKINKVFLENEENIIRFHRRYFSRIYPAGFRVDSSNFDPMNALFSGSQMIAMNIQTKDRNLLIYNSLFQVNGGINSGYVLKPKFLRCKCKGNHIFPSKMTQIKKILKIQIQSGHKIHRKTKNEKEKLYLEISLRGLKADELDNPKQRKEILIKNAIFCKINLSIDFKIRCPDLCFVLFEIYSKNEVFSDELMASYCIPFNYIREGYRIVPLLDNMHNRIENTFLMAHIGIQNL